MKLKTENRKHKVGIFSRDGEANYTWLYGLLYTEMFRNLVGNVQNIYISNNSGSFITGMSQSSFAILYHTKRRGRLNIANVTDSLYDDELKDLSDHLGRSNVVVLLDDVEDGSDSNMRRILEEQRLDSYATEVILISEQEKESAGLSGSDPSFSQSPISAQMHDAYNSLYHKLLTLKDTIKNAPHSNAAHHDLTSPESLFGSRRTAPVPSVVTSTGGFRYPDDSSVRSSQRAGSDLRNDEERNLLNDNDYRDPIGGFSRPQTYPTPPPPQIPGKNNINQQVNRNWRNDKVLWIIGGVIAFLVILLIIVLCVTL
ncbi:uncharacterized protein ACNLHF_026510 [Anomaloglossus baeobatrachus]|uniref:uncharacterized protein LOC142246590 n=1 Tax=Anomaloglossus baeobatrachus TaxID=238106 RepID=UPI003F508C1F